MLYCKIVVLNEIFILFEFSDVEQKEKNYIRVRIIAEKEKCAIDGAHKGMNSWIYYPNGQQPVCFDQCDDLSNFACVPIKE